MKLRLMDIIVCPKCKCRFTLKTDKSEKRPYSKAWEEKVKSFWKNRSENGVRIDLDIIWDSYQTEIITGDLRCESCAATYPVENGVPRILPPELRTVSGRMGRQDPRQDVRIETFMDQIQPVKGGGQTDLFSQIQMANQSNYGYEWNAFSHEYEGWESVYKEYYVFEKDAFFKGKIGLDAGCGMGRYTLVPVSKGAEMVGLDLSNAIEASYAKSVNIPTFHAIQGDIYNLPFRENFFEFAQSLGVIHIAPDPEGALRSIMRAVQEKKKIFVYVYPSFKDENVLKYLLLKLVNPLRKITVKLPSNYLYRLLYLFLPIVLVLFYFPSWVLWHIPGLRKISKILPYSYAQYRGRKIRDIHMNLFDRFGNPVERRYSRQEMEEWMGSAGLKEYTLHFNDGWSVSGVK